MPKYSVKKPFTILVAVILVLVLGFVSLMGIQTDLLPAMNLPYLLVITTYPGASPEQVETDVTQPLESALSTLNGVKNVTSQSNENYSLIYMEYQESTDMDSAMVKASTAVNQLGDTLPDMAGTPTLMEISPDMMATQYVAVDYDGMDIYALSDYVNETVLPQLERVDGVASISTTGLVEKTVEITLDQDKIDEVNDKLLVQVSDRLAEAKKELDANKAKINSGLKELDDAQAQLDAGKAQLNSQKADVTTQLRDAITELNKEIPALEKKIADLQKDLDDANRKLEEAKNNTTTLPEVTLPIDDALFASCRQVIADSGAAYDPAMLPANLAEAQSDLAKMGAMISAIDAADAAIRATAQNEGLLEQNMTVEQTSAYLDAQYTAMVSRIQTLDVEIASLTDQKNAAEAAGNQEEAERLQQRIDDDRSEQARCQSVIDANAARRARVNELNSSLTTLSTTKLALRNATVLLQARQQAESQLNNGLKPLQQTLNETVQALNEQLTKAQELLTQLNDQRAKLQKMLGDLGNEAIDPAMADMAVQLLLSGSEAQLQLGEFQLSSGRTQLEAGKTQLEAAQEDPRIEGLLVLLNTVGGDVEAGLALAELIASVSKPSATLVLGGGHSIGIPLAVSARRSFIVPTATMTVHPVRHSGVILGVPQTMRSFEQMQQRITGFVAAHSGMTEKRYTDLMLHTGELVMDMGTVLDGRRAVKEKLIDELGGLSDALAWLYKEIERK